MKEEAERLGADYGIIILFLGLVPILFFFLLLICVGEMKTSEIDSIWSIFVGLITTFVMVFRLGKKIALNVLINPNSNKAYILGILTIFFSCFIGAFIGSSFGMLNYILDKNMYKGGTNHFGDFFGGIMIFIVGISFYTLIPSIIFGIIYGRVLKNKIRILLKTH